MQEIYPGLNQKCKGCGKKITIEDFETILIAETNLYVQKNPGMRKKNMPGFYHKKCMQKFDEFIINNSFNEEDLSNKNIKNFI